MALNLKHIAYTDSDNLKLDKINYNFDQIVANGGGPQGSVGETGEQGHQGITGYQGVQGIAGPQGFQGPQGNNGEDIWKINEGSEPLLNTLLPKHDDGTDGGDPNPGPPSLVLGYKTTDPQYDTVEEVSVLVVNKSGTFENNIELRTSNVPQNAFVMRLEDNNGAPRQVFSFKNAADGTTPELNFRADKFTWNAENLDVSNDKIILDSQLFKVQEVDAEFDDVEIKGTFKYSHDSADLNKLAVAVDNEGTVEFKSVSEIGGALPVGSIVSVDPTIFMDDSDSGHFIQSQTGNGASAPIQFRVGSGKVGGAWAGWYVCNGQTWTDGVNSYPTPDLNQFNAYVQPEDGTSSGQQFFEINNPDTAIMGGANFSIDGQESSGEWTITTTLDDSNRYHGSGGENGSTTTIKRLVKVIFLGVGDLYWENGGVSVEQPTFQFSDWTGTISVDAQGNVTTTLGNATSVTVLTWISDEPDTPNDTPGENELVAYVQIGVPVGQWPYYSNANTNIAGQVNVTQPTTFIPDYTTTLTLTDAQGLTAAEAGTTISGIPATHVHSGEGTSDSEKSITFMLPEGYYWPAQEISTGTVNIPGSPNFGSNTDATPPSFWTFVTHESFPGIVVGQVYKSTLTAGGSDKTVEYDWGYSEDPAQDTIEISISKGAGPNGAFDDPYPDWDFQINGQEITRDSPPAIFNDTHIGLPAGTITYTFTATYTGDQVLSDGTIDLGIHSAADPAASFGPTLPVPPGTGAPENTFQCVISVDLSQSDGGVIGFATGVEYEVDVEENVNMVYNISTGFPFTNSTREWVNAPGGSGTQVEILIAESTPYTIGDIEITADTGYEFTNGGNDVTISASGSTLTAGVEEGNSSLGFTSKTVTPSKVTFHGCFDNNPGTPGTTKTFTVRAEANADLEQITMQPAFVPNDNSTEQIKILDYQPYLTAGYTINSFTITVSTAGSPPASTYYIAAPLSTPGGYSWQQFNTSITINNPIGTGYNQSNKDYIVIRYDNPNHTMPPQFFGNTSGTMNVTSPSGTTFNVQTPSGNIQFLPSN